ncbi:MAG: hypothetical protein AB7L09_01560 [Nitrospira sp.]
MSRRALWRTWGFTHLDLIDELQARVKREFAKTDSRQFEIDMFAFWRDEDQYELQKIVGDGRWKSTHLMSAELRTNFVISWGEQHEVVQALEYLRRRQVLEDLAGA